MRDKVFLMSGGALRPQIFEARAGDREARGLV